MEKLKKGIECNKQPEEGEDWVAARIVVISFFSFLWPLTLVNEVHVSNNALSVKIFFYS
jgi:hypothetical protein